MNAYEMVRKKIETESYKGNRHSCRRDAGRLAGGFHASGSLTDGDIQRLGEMAEFMSDTPKLAGREWREAVEYGRKAPVQYDNNEYIADGAFGWDDAIECVPEAHTSGLNALDGDVLTVDVPAPHIEYHKDLIRYLQAVFEPGDNVAYVTEAWKKEDGDKWLPGKGVCDRTAQQLIDALEKAGADIGAVLGDWKPEAGAWIRINPFDGEGVKDTNVTSYRHALIEADEGDLGTQLAIIRQLELPCSAIVHSGGKSIHAIVKVDAENLEQYRERVAQLYSACTAAGLKVDQQNRNPSRLSRMPGVDRNGRPQYMIDGRCGKECWQDWVSGPLEVKPLAELKCNHLDDENELIKHRFLCRGGGCLLIGPTGIGKSSFTMQMALSFALGNAHFGMIPKCPLNVCIIQAENDEGDMAEMRDGVLNAMFLSGKITEAEALKAAQAVLHYRDVTSTGAGVGKMLEAVMRQRSDIDMIVLDPAFSYLGGESNSAKDVGGWLRNVINPCIIKHNVGLVLVHHTNKPPRGIEKAEWQGGDFAYLGAGSAEWANWARGVLAIRSVGSDSIFQLTAGKRGKRLRWTDDEGNSITSRFVGHSQHGICWLPVTEAEALKATAKATVKPGHVSEHLTAALDIAFRQVWSAGMYKAALSSELGITADKKLRDLMSLVSESDEIGRARVQHGTKPVHLIGRKSDVEAEAERLKS